MELKDKIIVITGGSSGLGKGLAYALSKEGAKVVVCAEQKDQLEQAASEVNALPVVTDVTDEEQVKTLASKTIEKYGRIDIWINNAGIWMPHTSIETMDWKRVHELMEVNLFGTIYGSKAALIQMRKQGSGTIVNILSTSALEGSIGSSGYRASKFAAAGFTKCLRKEAESAAIEVLAVYPGEMQTNIFGEKKPENFNEYMSTDYVADKIVANIKQENPEEELIIKRPV